MSKNYKLKSIFSSIRTKLLLSFSLVIIISVTFVTYISITTYSQRLEENSIRYSNQVISNYIGNIQNYIQEIDKVADSIRYNFYIQRYLIEKEEFEDTTALPYLQDSLYSDNYQGSTDVLSNIINLRSDISSIFLMNDDGVSLYKSRYKEIDLDDLHQQVQLDANELITSKLKDLYAIKNVHYYNTDFTAFQSTKNLDRYDGHDSLGLIHIETNLSIIEKHGNSAILNEGGMLIVVDQSGDFVYQSPSVAIDADNFPEKNTLSLPLMTQVANDQDHGYFIEKISNKDYHYVYQIIPKTGWYVATVTPYETILSEANEIRSSVVLISLISLLIILLITYYIATQFTKPIISLKTSMDEADNNNQFNSMVEVKSSDEIGDLTLSFNHMITRIKGLMDQVVTEQEEKRNAEIKVLQDQINPHFLYNTLDTIIWMAETNDENTVPMIEALSQLFRISLSKGQEFITIEEELEHVSNYLYILRTRYLDKFDYDISSDASLLRYKIPKIILQPLIENAIYHGVKNIETKGHIQITVTSAIDVIMIKITDNGIGMPIEKCKAILNDEATVISKSGSGVGVRNVNQRIKLYYGDAYGLRYESMEGHGTTVTITLPLNFDAPN